MLVLLANDEAVKILQESWFKRTLVSPDGFKIYRFGFSGGCSVTPFPQVNNLLLLWLLNRHIICRALLFHFLMLFAGSF